MLNSLRSMWFWRSLVACLVLALIYWLIVLRTGFGFQAKQSRIIGHGGHVDSLQHDINNATFGFERILAINLPARKDHRDALILAASLTGVQVDFIDGVRGIEVADETLPPHALEHDFSAGVKGSWRAHLDALYYIVYHNISTALIIEDDIDWDIRIRHQLRNFAKASLILSQPLRSSHTYLDPSFTEPGSTPPEHTDLHLELADLVTTPNSSPYGDFWDVLWLGHCGTTFPNPSDHPKLPRGRVVMDEDASVVSAQHFDKDWGSDELIKQYSEHTRVVHHTADNVCSLAYAVTQHSAKQILHQLGRKYFDSPFDLMLRQYCDGTRPDTRPRNCLTVEPQLFNHHRSKGNSSSWSNIGEWRDPKDGNFKQNDVPYTLNVRWSTMVNIEKLLDGENDFIDSYPD